MGTDSRPGWVRSLRCVQSLAAALCGLALAAAPAAGFEYLATIGAGPGSASGQLRSPAAVATDSAGDVHVADTGNHRVQRFSGEGAFLSATTGFSAPLGAALRSELFVADSGNDRILAPASGTSFASATGLREEIVDDPRLTLGSVERSDLLSPATDPRLIGVIGWMLREHTIGLGPVKTNHPQFTSSGAVSEHYNGRAFDVTTVDGSPVSPSNAAARDAAADLADLPPELRPTEIGTPFAIAGPGYFTDASHQDKLHIGFNTQGTGRLYSRPGGVAIDPSGDVVVADTFNNRVRRFSPNGALVRAFGGFGAGNGQLRDPGGVAVDSTGNVYVADPGNGRVQKFSSGGAFLAAWGGFSAPRGVAVDAADAVYVADTGTGTVKKLSAAGAPLATYGTAGSGPGELSQPQGLAVDCRANLYVADTGNNRVQKFGEPGTPTGCPVAGGGPDGGPGDPFGETNGNDTITGTAAAEKICGLLGDDVIKAQGGNDTVFGDLCDVKARLGAAQVGAGGNDIINGGAGNDTLYGAAGNDKLFADDGNDKVFGGDGNDSLHGGKGKDSLDGGKGNDKLTGGADFNKYKGGSGNDTVNAKNGKRETVDCGSGKKDSASVDKADKVKNCEKVKRARK